jgi:hypothetical protein
VSAARREELPFQGVASDCAWLWGAQKAEISKITMQKRNNGALQ